jgi:hypothetical protein
MLSAIFAPGLSAIADRGSVMTGAAITMRAVAVYLRGSVALAAAAGPTASEQLVATKSPPLADVTNVTKGLKRVGHTSILSVADKAPISALDRHSRLVNYGC